MAETAYDLRRFETQSNKTAPRLRVVKRNKSERQKQMIRMVRILLGTALLVLAISGMLYTRASLTELQKDIATAQKALAEQESLNAYLNFSLDNQSSLRNIEDQAEGLGLFLPDSGQVTYFRVDEGAQIQVRENGLARILGQSRNGLLNIFGYTQGEADETEEVVDE